MVRKITVHCTLLKIAPQKTLSANSAAKLEVPTKLGSETPSQLVKAVAKVSRAGTSTMAMLSASAGATNSA